MNTSQCQRPRVKSDRKVYPPPAVTGELTAGIGTKIKDLIEGCAVLSVLADDTSEFYWATAILDGGRIVGVTLTKFGGTSPTYHVFPDPETGEWSCTVRRSRLQKSPLQAHRRPDRRPDRGGPVVITAAITLYVLVALAEGFLIEHGYTR